MARIPTPEETAQEILSLFVEHFGGRPGHVLRSNNFLAIWLPRATEDFGPGMRLAVERGWIEPIPPNSYRLTEDGFAAQQPISDIDRQENLGLRAFMEEAIRLSRNCVSEAGKTSPKVGAVVIDKAGTMTGAYRGEGEAGHHAEFALLERKLPDAVLAGATLFTTLEPCTSRNPPKIACAERIVERRIKKVFIGVLDPNPDIRGKGELRLRAAGIEVARFDSDLMPIIEELNRDFSRQFRN